MRRIFIGAGILVMAGCATKQDVYWTQKDGAVTVHHVTGNTDHAEKLTKKQLSKDDTSKFKLPGKEKYFIVKQQDSVFIPVSKDNKPKKQSDNSKDKLAQVTSELHDLKKQVSNLKEELREKDKPKVEEPIAKDSKEETLAESDAPRMSQ